MIILCHENNQKTTRKQPESFINHTLNKYNIRTFDYENILFIIDSGFS